MLGLLWNNAVFGWIWWHLRCGQYNCYLRATQLFHKATGSKRQYCASLVVSGGLQGIHHSMPQIFRRAHWLLGQAMDKEGRLPFLHPRPYYTILKWGFWLNFTKEPKRNVLVCSYLIVLYCLLNCPLPYSWNKRVCQMRPTVAWRRALQQIIVMCKWGGRLNHSSIVASPLL